MRKLLTCIIVVLMIFSVISCAGCASEKQEVSSIMLDRNSPFELMRLDEFSDRSYADIIPEYSTELSLCFKDSDGGKTLMIFAAPIQYVNELDALVPIDTRIANVTDQELLDKGYAYKTADCDIMSYYPEYLSSEGGILLDKDVG